MTDEQYAEDGKTLAVVSYLFIIGAIIAIIMNNDKNNPFISFHNRQGLGLSLLQMLLGYFISQFDSWQISIGFWIGLAMLFFYGISSAVSGTKKEVPLVGTFFQKLFSFIGN